MTGDIGELAIFSGTPLFAEPLHVGRPNLPDEDLVLERVRDVLRSGQLTNGGPNVLEFEQRVREIADTQHCIAVCNGTMALQIMARACNLQGEVIVPAMTFVATAHALEWIGLTPVFADIDAESHTLDAESVESSITPETTAILGVHLWGNPCHVLALQKIADRHGLQLLFDASHGFGCAHQGRSIGGFGVAESFSFHATKFVHSIEGGAIVTNDDDVAERCRLYRNFGITGFTRIQSAGINGKMNELTAAIGLCSIEQLESLRAVNLQNLRFYRSAFARLPGISLLEPTADFEGNGQYVVALIDETAFGVNRNHLHDILRAEGIFVRKYFEPGCHRAEPYSGNAKTLRTPLTCTDNVLGRVLQFPTGAAVSVSEICAVGELLKTIHASSATLCQQLGDSRRHLFQHPCDFIDSSHPVSEAA